MCCFLEIYSLSQCKAATLQSRMKNNNQTKMYHYGTFGGNFSHCISSHLKIRQFQQFSLQANMLKRNIFKIRLQTQRMFIFSK